MNPKFNLLTLILVFFCGLLLGFVVDARLLPPARSARATVSSAIAPVQTPKHITAKPVAEKLDTTGPPPKLIVPDPAFNFGKRERGEFVKHEFILRNDGGQTLVVEKVLPGCGCTVADLSSKIIAPGGQATVSAVLSLHLQEGALNKSIMVQTNDPAQPQFELHMIGTATSRIQFEPKRAQMGSVSEGKNAAQSVKLDIDSSLWPIKVTGIETSDPNLKAEAVPLKGEHAFEVKVWLAAPRQTGAYQGWVHLMTNGPEEYNVIGLPVTAQIMYGGESAAAR